MNLPEQKKTKIKKQTQQQRHERSRKNRKATI